MTQKTFIFIGRSGCGKGTQARFLIQEIEQRDPEKRPIFYLETGARFRELAKGESYSSRLVSDILEKGGRQPDFLAVWCWSTLLVDQMDDKKHLVVDGMPRSYQEALVLDTAIDFYNLPQPTIIYINVSKEWSKQRMLARGRSDDQTDAMERRLSWFDTEVSPALKFFKHHPGYNFVEVNGERPIEEVTADMMSKIEW